MLGEKMKKPVVFALGLGLGAVLGAAGGIAFVAYSAKQTPRQTAFSNVVMARAPFEGDWLISWGGEDPKDNHHIGSPPQDRAVDIRKIIEGGGNQTCQGDPKQNESYGCWAQPIYAPIDGVVAVAVDGVPDNIPGELNRPSAMGNYMMLKSPDGFVVVLAHFKQGSVARKAGEQIKAGDFLALCGNSGNSTEPHLHMHVQSGISMAQSVAMRMVFPSITVNGEAQEKYSPKRGDVISNGRKKTDHTPEPTAPSSRGRS